MNPRLRRFVYFFIAALYALLFIVRVEVLVYQKAQENLVHFANEQVEIKGRIVSDPDRRDTSLHLNVAVSEVNGSPANGTLLALVPRDSQIAYGEEVELSGTLIEPQSFLTDTGHTFDYAGYLSVEGVSMVLQKATVVASNPAGLSVFGLLYSLKHEFEGALQKLFPEPDNSLLEGILLGERGGIPKDLNNNFIKSGLVHIVALSGYNLSIVAVGVFSVLRFLPRTMSLAGGAGVMILFALMTGGSATTVRALVMALIALLARYLGRNALATRSLIFAALMMALWNPLILIHDPSFILSVLATFGLITLMPWVESWLPKFILKRPILRESIASTIAVEIFVLPALLYFTGVLSLLSVFANALVLPVVPWAMLAGFIAGLAGLVHPALGYAPALIGDLMLKWIMFVTQTIGSLPFSALVVPEFSFWIVALVYVPLTLAASSIARQNVLRRRPS